MSLRPQFPLPPVPEDTARVAQIAFRRGNSYLLLRARLGTIFADTEFADLYPKRGQPWNSGDVGALLASSASVPRSLRSRSALSSRSAMSQNSISNPSGR